MTRRTALALLALPVLALTACGGGGEQGEAAAEGGTVAASGAPEAQEATVVGTPSLTFRPETVTAAPGTLALTMQIEGGVPHDLEFTDAGLGDKIPVISDGSATGTYTFDAPGTYDFVCTLHPGMDGQVVVS